MKGQGGVRGAQLPGLIVIVDVNVAKLHLILTLLSELVCCSSCRCACCAAVGRATTTVRPLLHPVATARPSESNTWELFRLQIPRNHNGCVCCCFTLHFCGVLLY